MDVMMPGKDGYETIRAIRTNSVCHDKPIVAVTAKALEDDREKCLEAGASDYLPKPVDVNLLLELIRRLSGKPQDSPDSHDPPSPFVR
jgi:CheY-like chemotaxis protein